MDAKLYRYTEEGGWQPSFDSSLDGENTLVLYFSDLPGDRADAPLEGLKGAFPRSAMAGCSTAGQIHQQHYFERGASAAVIRFHRSCLRLNHVDIGDHGDFRAAGEALVRPLDRPDLAAVLILSEGLQVNGSAVMEGVNRVLGGRVPVTGGLAADGARFERTWVLSEGERVPGRICAVGILGDALGIGHGSFGGWDVLGPERLVTRSEGNRLFELDGQPALELYKRYLGEKAAELPASGLLFPLALRRQEDDREPKVRTILAVDEASQSMTFAGDIPQGSYVQLMYANFDRLVEGAGRALEDFDATEVGERPLVCLAVSCVGRRLILGQRIEEEIEALAERLPPQTRLLGFYSYGELSPLASGYCDLHNQTMTVTLWWER
ncbi:MAG TPA: hypothetical protein ENJ98_03165 [Thiolapillus brandeum]|uniref:Histidine kinase n=1 Tax=Thiolapillus brandeum TaxID=1076588 RepID=A0A7C5IYF1_9GAMM|nr:hypothetical protein [Thiolapillus brandeum]